MFTGSELCEDFWNYLKTGEEEEEEKKSSRVILRCYTYYILALPSTMYTVFARTHERCFITSLHFNSILFYLNYILLVFVH